MSLQTKQTCPDCGRSFDLVNETDAQEWFYGHDCQTPKYGPEGAIPLPWGGELRFEDYATAEVPTYVRIVDQQDREVVYWTIDEFRDDPALVLGALLGAMQHGRVED